jgi:hypothetical protein
MASIISDNTTDTAMASIFMSLPGELRNAIYHHYFETIFESQGLEPNVTCRHVESLRPALSVLRTSRAIRAEASSIFWIDFVTRCHWGYGAHYDEDDRMASFCEAASRYTSKVDIIFQKRHLDTSSMSSNLVWLVLESACNPAKDDEALQRLRQEWIVKHQIQGGFVWAKLASIGSCEDAMVMKYTYESDERSWVQFWGRLTMIE